MLTAVDELRVRDVRIHLWEAGVWSSFISGFQTFALRDIRISYGIRFELFSQLIDNLGAFPCLKHISLHVVSRVDNVTLMTFAAQKVSTRLQSLELGSVGIGHKGSILPLASFSWSLKQLDLGFATSHVDGIEGTPFLTVYYFRA